MKLHIRHNNSIRQAITAAFIRGEDVCAWLKEISLWNLPVADLECYIMPVSVQSLDPGGLFIIFQDPAKIKQINLLEPYSCVEQKLYIPVNAELIPQISKHELEDISLWDRQVFHPAIGFVGFEQKDRVNLADLFSYGNPIAGDWSFANPGIQPKPAFYSIHVIQPTAEELIDAIKNEIGQKPLDEIPTNPEDESSAIGKLFDSVKYNLLKGILSAGKIVGGLLPEGNNYNTSDRAGLLQKLQNWLEQNLEELEKKRNDEIKRLLKLFDENNQEALQYAIPLDSPYLNRGSETSSSSLTRRSLTFNLGSLGGGQVIDSWNVGNYYNDLRAKYLLAAQREIERKDFKKAAYVYAHLLGDYYAAANVLQQGGMYREAAALYKDHLKNITSAAECLEKGGLYVEAIELYKELDRDEKVGDLYMNLRQAGNAEQHYEKHIAARLLANDNLDAARVINEKLKQTDRAGKILLNGWKGVYQAEPCLKSYFDIVIKTEPESTERSVKEIFTRHTPSHKRLSLLEVLEYVSKKRRNDAVLTATTQDIAYEIVHSEAENGNVTVLNNLKRFLPEDKLIGSDTSRYTMRNLNSDQSKKTQVFHLDKSIKWANAVWHRNQFLVIGRKDKQLHMVRGNWYANLEYYSWDNIVTTSARLTFINSPYYCNHILLHSSDGTPIAKKNLQKNKYFNEALVVHSPAWMQKGAAQCLINEEREICSLEVENNKMTLHHYSLEGTLKKSINCYFKNDHTIGHITSHPYIAHHNGYFYTYKDKQFIIISDGGLGYVFAFDTIIRLFAVSNSITDFYLVISTNKGCFLSKPSKGELNVIEDVLFAIDLIPSAITFITADKFVITEKNKAVLFEIVDGKPGIIKTFETQTPIVAALPTSLRLQFALFEEDGQVTMCEG